MGRKTDYLLIGGMTADLTSSGYQLGGAVSYCAYTAHAFNLHVTAVTSAAADEPLLEDLRQQANVVLAPSEATTVFENIYTPDGRVQFARSVCGPVTRELVQSTGMTAPLVHLGPIAVETDPTCVFDYPDSTVMLTPQGWMRRWGDDGQVHFKPWFEPDVVRSADIVVFSQEDVAPQPGLVKDYIDVAKHLIVTRAENGLTYYHDGQIKDYPAIPVNAAHPTGAGDVFAASLLASLPLFDHDMHRAILAAIHFAAISVTRAGMESAPRPDEVQTILDKYR